MKKKAVAAMWVFVASLVFGILTINTALANTPLLDRTLPLTDLALELKTPQSIAHYMWRHFIFEQDQRNFGQSEYWQSPEEFLKTGKGDCEDFAIFARELLHLNGINAFLLNIYGPGYGHTICVFMENGKYNAIDGTNVENYQADNLPDLMTKINPFWNEGAVVAPSKTSSSGVILQTIPR